MESNAIWILVQRGKSLRVPPPFRLNSPGSLFQFVFGAESPHEALCCVH